MSEAATQIVVVGAGGLGVSAGWGICAGWPSNRPLQLQIVDPDAVELSNLNRQVLFHETDLGEPKAACLRKRLLELCDHTSVKISAEQRCVERDSIDLLLGSATLVIDATDSTATKFLLNDYCVAQKIPLVYAGAVAEQGQLMLIPAGSGTACLRCLFGELNEKEIELQSNRCRSEGIFGSVVGQIGFLQAEHAIRWLLDDASSSVLLRLTLENPIPKETKLQADPSCPLGCGKASKRILDIRDKQCPDTFLYTKLALEKLNKDELLDLRLGSEVSLNSVVETVTEDGYQLALPAREIATGHWRVFFGRD